MPNTRRRKFSVQNNTATRDQYKLKSAPLNSFSQKDSKSDNFSQNNDAMNAARFKNETIPNSSKSDNSSIIIVEECKNSNTSFITKTTIQNEYNTDKDAIVSSNNIDLLGVLSVTNDTFDAMSLETLRERDSDKSHTKRDSRQVNRERTPVRRDKYLAQHRVKIRSPKRQTEVPKVITHVAKHYQITTGTTPIDWDEMQQNVLILAADISAVSHNNDEETRRNIHCLTFKSDLDDMCRICHSGEASLELGPLISACSCRGTIGRVHVKCLEHWLTESGKSRCELCGTRYVTQRVHRYGVPRALIMWILSQNTKQLMVDSLGIMLMSPLAVLAAWLSGRTLAGLMSQESYVTPWPMASTFVLACMTLVCYYCWIVSAATRHALGWWIWYRSQYEVRLQFQGNEE